MKKIIFVSLFFIFITGNSFSNSFVFQKNADLNGDRKIDKIKLEINANGSGEYILKVNDKSITGSLDDDLDGFKVIDIDKKDKYLEVAVHSPGPSDDDVYIIYFYTGNELKKMATLSRWPKFMGNGIIYLENLEGFWIKNDKYLLNNRTRKIKQIRQELYYVNVKAKVKNKFIIYQTRKRKRSLTHLMKGSELLIIACDTRNKKYPNYIYLVKTSAHIMGWVRGKELEANVQNLPYAD